MNLVDYGSARQASPSSLKSCGNMWTTVQKEFAMTFIDKVVDTIGAVASVPGALVDAARSLLESLSRPEGTRTSYAGPLAQRESVVVPVLLVRQSVDEAAYIERKRHTM